MANPLNFWLIHVLISSIWLVPGPLNGYDLWVQNQSLQLIFPSRLILACSVVIWSLRTLFWHKKGETWIDGQAKPTFLVSLLNSIFFSLQERDRENHQTLDHHERLSVHPGSPHNWASCGTCKQSGRGNCVVRCVYCALCCAPVVLVWGLI